MPKKFVSVYRRPLKQLLHQKIGNMEQRFNSPELGSSDRRSDIDNRDLSDPTHFNRTKNSIGPLISYRIRICGSRMLIDKISDLLTIIRKKDYWTGLSEAQKFVFFTY